MKIHARSSKKLSPPHPETASFIAAVLRASTAELPDILGPVDVWRWPRSDLHWWIKVLNKFDAVLEEIIREYEVDKLQANEFSLLSKKTILDILAFERLLLENSTNRKLFNSYDRLSSLLFSSDLDVVVADLQLLLRPAQQYSAQASVSHALNISTSRLQALAKRWSNVRENGLELVDLASEKKEAEVEALPAEASEVNHTFYRKLSSEGKAEVTSNEGDVFGTQQRKQNVSSAAPVIVHLGPLAHSSKSAINILAETIESYSVPNEERFELFSKIRVARSLGKGRGEERVKLVIIRLLAIAVFCLTQNESTAQSSIFLYEPDLIAQVAELLHLDRGISVAVQTAAIAALDAMGRYRSKIQELLTAVNAGVNHGILMSLLRKTVADITSSQSTLPNGFIETLISFITFIASHASGGNMLVAAGLIPMLIQIIENRNASRLSILSRTMQLVDNIAYGFPNAFQLFCNAHGVDAVVQRIEYEVNLDVEMYLDGGSSLSFTRAGVLKHTLRTLHRMMQTSGTAEGLRGLIDSSLIQSIKKIIEHRSLFGASVLPIAIHVMATFVHNEPTSLAVLQEAKLPGVFYQAVEDYIEPSIEVIQAIINAIGALCLNQMGLEQLTSRPNIISSIFSVFTSDRHLKVLSEKENAAIFGTAVDELIRHHPTLKDSVFAAISTVFQKIEEIGQGHVDDTEAESHYRLVLVSGDAEPETTMDVADVSTTERLDVETPEAILEGEQSKQESVDNIVVAFIDVMSRFLEGVFQHAPHCRDFVGSTDCLDRLSKIITLPCIPYNYGSSIASDSLVQILRAMTEVSPAQTINKVINHVRTSLDETRSFWSTTGGQSKLLRYVEPLTSEDLANANTEFRKLVSLLTHVTILADVFASYAHSRSALSLVPSLLAEEASGVLSDLGALHRACIWENIALKSTLVKNGLLSTRIEKSSSVETSTSTSQTIDLLNESGTLAAVPGLEQVSPEQKVKDSSNKETPQQRNAKALKHLSTEIPTSLTPFFQAVVRLPSMYSRRNPDVAQKRQIVLLSEQVAKIVLGHLQLEALDESLASYAYWTVMIGLLILLIYEERSSQSTVNTVLLVALNKVGGIAALLTICHRYISVPERVFGGVGATDDKEEQHQELVHAFGGLKVAFQLLHILVSSKPLLESPQTALMTTKDKKDTDTDYFEAQDFIVRLRSAVLPFVREVWEAQWLLSAPINLCKSVVQTILELLAGENEEFKGDPSTELTATMAGATSILHRQHLPPDENGITQLCDMGFPRGAATRALTRMRNNVAAAAEYLLGQPFPLPADPEEPAQEEHADGSDNSSSEDGEQESGPISDTSMRPLESAEAVAAPIEAPTADKGKEPETSKSELEETTSSEQRRTELNEAREPVKENLGRRALQLLDEHPSLIFDVKGAFISSAEGYSSRTLPLIIQDIKDFSPSAYGVHEQSLAVRCRLLALVLNEVGSLENRLSSKISKELMDVLVALLLAHPTNAESGTPVVPKWLATHLLVTEALLVAGDEPKNITIPGEDEEIIPQPVTDEPSYSAVRGKLFQLCLKFLVDTELSHDELIAVMRLIVYLSREYSIARELVNLGGVHSLLERFRRLSKEANGCQVYVVLILRHIAEDQCSLDIFIKQEVKRWFSSPRTKVSEVSSFIRGSAGIVMRDPKAFLRVTESLCQLVQPHPSVYQISLKPSRPGSNKKEHGEKADEGDEMQVDERPPETVANETVEFMMQYVIGELMRIGKAAMQGCNVTAQGTDKSKAGEALNETGTMINILEEEARGDHSYACFLMQCLTELLFSYNSCKLAMLNYSKKKSVTPSKDATPKHRPTVLNFLLSELTSFGTLDPVATPASKRRVVLCNLSMSVMAALCLNIPEYNDGKEAPPDLVTVRRVVLDAVSKAIRDPLPSESIEERYGRLLALSDLCHRFLTVKAGYGPTHKPQDDGPLHMAKLMLEKNYVATLTNALAEVDLNYPNVRVLVGSILRPLEHLSKIAIKMGRVADKGKDKDTRLADLESELSEESDSEEEEEREETPDLYRNSSLGIYSGEMDDGHDYGSDDEMGEDDEVGDEVDMEYGEEDTSGSENTSLDSEAEDVDHVHLHAEDEEGWHEEDEDEMDDEDEDEDEDEGDVEDEDIHDDVEDQEIAWQDVTGPGLEADEGQIDDMDEEEILEGMPAADDAEDGLVSEVEELADIGILEHTGLTPSDGENAVGQWFGELAIGRDGQHHFFPGPPRPRRTAHDLAIFGTPRNTASGAPEATTHPLLVDPSSSGGIPHSHSRNSHRRVNRGNQAANNYTDLLQTIEDLVSGGALQLFQQLMSAGRGGASELHIDLGPIGGHHLIPGVDRNTVHRHGARATLFAAPRSDRPTRSADQRSDVHEFGPLPTHQRWVEEAKIAHGKFLMERVGRVSNYVTLALLPAAREAAKVKQKLKEQQEEEERRKHEEEEAIAKANADAQAVTHNPAQGEDIPSDSIPAPDISAPRTEDEDAIMEDATNATEQSATSHDVEEAVAGMEGVTVNDLEPPTNETSGYSASAATPDVTETESPTNNQQEHAEAGPSIVNTRVTVMVHGNPVDITDTGIDPTFLEALPDDMREEVLNQHFRERRIATQDTSADSQISREFLDALPAELQAEILAQERSERAQVQAATTGQNAASAGPVDIDPASFLASLDPQLRQVVLMDQEDGFLQTLPSHLIAEATGWREHRSPPRVNPDAGRAASHPEATPRKSLVQRDAIQLLDKNGLATLVRLLFFPQLSRKSLLLKVLVNLCENSKTRAELLNLLLSILQDGTGDLAAVDKSFAQLSFKSRPSIPSQVTPKPTKGKSTLEASSTPNRAWQTGAENIPNLVVQRSLEALTFIVSANEFASRFFLTEHEVSSGLKRNLSRKGKGKEKQAPQMQYPIVPLLALLDRQTLLRTPTMMDSLAALLATITRPLTNLKDKKEDTTKDVSPAEDVAATTDQLSSTHPLVSEATPSTTQRPLVAATETSTNVLAVPAAALSSSVPVNTTNITSTENNGDKVAIDESSQQKIPPLQLPSIPASSLRLIVNILTVGECSGRTFQSTLALIQHLSPLPDARDTIAMELRVKAQDLGHSIYKELDELVGVLERDDAADEVPATISAKFSPASSDQAKLLRVLKTIDYMYSNKSIPSPAQVSSSLEAENKPSDQEKVTNIYESFHFAPLWRRLGDCLAVVEQKPDVEHMATVLLPLIESLMVVCKYIGPQSSSSRFIRGSASPRSPTTGRESMEDLFTLFTDAHRKVLNLMVRNNPSLMSGSFALLVQNPRVLDFDNKRNYFYQQLRRRPHSREHHGTLQLNVRRQRVFEDSFQYLQRRTGEQIKYGKLSVRFYDEEGVDAGGVTREWFQILARQMFNPNYALFQPCAADKLTYQPNRASWVNPEHLSFFKFVGRIIGKAIFDNRLLEAYFARSLYRQLLGKPVDYRDVEWVDPEYYNSLVWILENDPTPLELTFSTEADEFGVTRLVELKENGASIPVTQDNKREFVQLSADYRLTKSIKEQIDALLGGFYDIIPKDLISIFNEKEVELLISGTPDIDIDEWRAATEYNGYTSSDPVIVWWWRALKSFNRDERAKVLSFATGTSRVPLGGFTELQGVQGVQKFSIHKAYGNPDRLPQAHTCFNQIDLPQYSSYDKLRQQLLLAINEGGEGFGFA